MLEDAVDAERRHDDEPHEHDRAEGPADARRALRLDREQGEQDGHGGRQHEGLQRRRELLHSFKR